MRFLLEYCIQDITKILDVIFHSQAFWIDIYTFTKKLFFLNMIIRDKRYCFYYFLLVKLIKIVKILGLKNI